jgi:hypothetical protein
VIAMGDIPELSAGPFTIELIGSNGTHDIIEDIVIGFTNNIFNKKNKSYLKRGKVKVYFLIEKINTFTLIKMYF